jgi:hypothetical protein
MHFNGSRIGMYGRKRQADYTTSCSLFIIMNPDSDDVRHYVRMRFGYESAPSPAEMAAIYSRYF